MKFFLMAGGFGKRAVPLSLEKPKPLFPLGGKPLARLMIDQLRRVNCHEGFINLHHLSDQIQGALRDERGLTFFHEERLSGSLVLKRAQTGTDDLLLVINGDVYMDIPLAAMKRLLVDKKADGVLAVRPQKQGYPSLSLRGRWFQKVEARGQASHGPSVMYTGLALFSQRALEAIQDANFFTSFQKERIRIACLTYRGIWLEIGTPAGYFSAVWRFQKHVGETGSNALSPQAAISMDSRVERSIVWEGARIEQGSSLSECIVTSQVQVEGCRARRMIITGKGTFPIV